MKFFISKWRRRQDEEEFFLGYGPKKLGKSAKRKLVESQAELSAAFRRCTTAEALHTSAQASSSKRARNEHRLPTPPGTPQPSPPPPIPRVKSPAVGITVTVPSTGNVEKKLAVGPTAASDKVSGMGKSNAEEAVKLAVGDRTMVGDGGYAADSGQAKVSIVEVSLSPSRNHIRYYLVHLVQI